VRVRGHTVKMVAAALGGEGGGVFTNWIIDVAEANNWLCQTTSLAGVAQRTGATIYYIELFPRAELGDSEPVLSLFPAQGDIDITITSEIAEAGRMIERGFVTKDLTTLISSSHRVYGISEKSDLGDGAIDHDALITIADKYAKSFVCFDMAEIASAHQSVISSVMLGALAASGALPFDKAGYEQAIRDTGKSVACNLAAFEASFQHATAPAVNNFDPAQSKSAPVSDTCFILPAAQTHSGKALLERAAAYDICVQEIIYHALLKLVDYQDYAYAGLYLDKLEKIFKLEKDESDTQLTAHVARYLALWMCYEDIPRVAQLKTRASRVESIRKEVLAKDQQIIYVAEFFRPRVEEVCAMLPAGLAVKMLNNRTVYRFLDIFMVGRKLRTDTVLVFGVLALLAKMRRFRRSSLGYLDEHARIDSWLSAIGELAAQDNKAAIELAACGRLIKGYGDTRARTTQQMAKIIERARGSLSAGAGSSARELAQWRDAAFADDENNAFDAAIAVDS